MTPQQVQTLVRGQLSGRSKVFHAVLLVVAAAMATVVTSIWITEPALPARTHMAFAVLVVIALGWVAHAVRVLTHTAILLVPHQVQAARLSMAACAVFLSGCLAASILVGGQAAVLATMSAIVMMGVSVFNTRRAHARHTALLRRRDQLLASSDPASLDPASSEPSGFSPTDPAGLKPGCSEDRSEPGCSENEESI